jgi:hypothetical protein
VNEDRGHGAMPKLYGAPAYARPPVVATIPVGKPFDPDALPLESERTSDEQELVSSITARSYESVATADPLPTTRDGSSMLRGRPFRLRIPGRPRSGGPG